MSNMMRGGTEDYQEEPVIPGSKGNGSDSITAEQLKGFLPRGSSARLTDEVLAKINNTEKDVGIPQDVFNEQILSYTHLLKGGVSMDQLVNAIRFCNIRMIDKMSNAKAWKIVFPVKAKEIEGRGQSVDSFASMYNNTKLVTEISKLVLMPLHITFAPLHMAAVKKQFDLMNGIGAKGDDYVSPTVQQKAAETLAMLTKVPEDNSIELKIGMSDEAISVQQNLTEQLGQMAEIQLARLAAGGDLAEVQQLGITFTDADIIEE